MLISASVQLLDVEHNGAETLLVRVASKFSDLILYSCRDWIERRIRLSNATTSSPDLAAYRGASSAAVMHRVFPQASSHECDGKVVPVSGRRRKRRYGVAVNPRYCCHSTPRQIAGTASIGSAAALPVAWIVWSTTATILGFPFFASFPCNPNHLSPVHPAFHRYVLALTQPMFTSTFFGICCALRHVICGTPKNAVMSKYR